MTERTTPPDQRPESPESSGEAGPALGPNTVGPNTPPIAAALLDLLRCPQTGSPLRPATADELARLNERIESQSQTIRDASGEPVAERLDAALVTRCGTWLYAIRAQIPAMIPEEAIAGEHLHRR